MGTETKRDSTIKPRRLCLILFCVVLTALNAWLCINMYREHDGYFTFGTILLYSPVLNLISCIVGIMAVLVLKRHGGRSNLEFVAYVTLPLIYMVLVSAIGLSIGGGGC